MTLLPGTIISTGTPSGVGMGFDPPKFLKPGDVVTELPGATDESLIINEPTIAGKQVLRLVFNVV